MQDAGVTKSLIMQRSKTADECKDQPKGSYEIFVAVYTIATGQSSESDIIHLTTEWE